MLTKIKNFINSFTEPKGDDHLYDHQVEALIKLAQIDKKYNDSMYELDLLREQSAGRIYDV